MVSGRPTRSVVALVTALTKGTFNSDGSVSFPTPNGFHAGTNPSVSEIGFTVRSARRPVSLYPPHMASGDPYRRIARIYDRVIEPMQTGVRSVAHEVLPPQRGWQVLDVGCGTGTGLTPYLDAGCIVAGVDVSEAMLERAADHVGGRAELYLTHGDALPFEDDRFDLVTTTMVLHEVPADARASLVTEMARVAKPDGRLLLVDFRFESLRGWRGPAFRAVSGLVERFSGHYSHYRTFKTDGGVPAVTKQAGLDVRREKIVAGGNVAIYLVAPR
jgi:ubiquinone/menaquinone biosynthesis C-methylase UbiE